MPRPASLLRSLGLAVLAVALPVGIAAQAADALTVTTPYPAVVADPGGTVRLPLTIDGNTTGTIALEATGAPTGWTTSFRGGGSLVTAAYVDGSKPASVDLEVKVPSDATPGTYRTRRPRHRAWQCRQPAGRDPHPGRLVGWRQPDSHLPDPQGPGQCELSLRPDAQQRHQPAADLRAPGVGSDRLDGRRSTVELEPGSDRGRRRRCLDPDPGHGSATCRRHGRLVHHRRRGGRRPDRRARRPGGRDRGQLHHGRDHARRPPERRRDRRLRLAADAPGPQLGLGAAGRRGHERDATAGLEGDLRPRPHRGHRARRRPRP